MIIQLFDTYGELGIPVIYFIAYCVLTVCTLIFTNVCHLLLIIITVFRYYVSLCRTRNYKRSNIIQILYRYSLYSLYRKYVHYNDVIMSAMASQITSLTIVYSNFYLVTDQRKHWSPASLAFVRGIHRGPVNSPQKVPETRKTFPFDDVIKTFYHFVQASERPYPNCCVCQCYDNTAKMCAG